MMEAVKAASLTFFSRMAFLALSILSVLAACLAAMALSFSSIF
jgi:hypothetical protein